MLGLTHALYDAPCSVPRRCARACCGRSSYQALNPQRQLGKRGEEAMQLRGLSSVERTPRLMAAVTVLRCLKFSMNCAAALKLWRILCGTLALAVSLPTSSSGAAGTFEALLGQAQHAGPEVRNQAAVDEPRMDHVQQLASRCHGSSREARQFDREILAPDDHLTRQARFGADADQAVEPLILDALWLRKALAALDDENVAAAALRLPAAFPWHWDSRPRAWPAGCWLPRRRERSC